MAYNAGKTQLLPSQPNEPPTTFDDFQRGPPPPSYEECLNMPSAGVVPHQQYQNYNMTTHQQLPQAPPLYQIPQYSQNYNMSEPSGTANGYANPYQTHMHQQQIYYNTSAVASPQFLRNSPENVLLFAKEAKIRKTATGAISVPPPPPGCAPTSAQLKAMCGQPVIVKKQKKSFF